MTSLPTWAVWVLSFGSPTLTAAVALVGQRISRRGTQELESRSKREEVMRKTRIVVTDAQVEAARMIVDHNRARGRETSEAIRKIAAAVPQVANGAGGQRK